MEISLQDILIKVKENNPSTNKDIIESVGLVYFETIHDEIANNNLVEIKLDYLLKIKPKANALNTTNK